MSYHELPKLTAAQGLSIVKHGLPDNAKINTVYYKDVWDGSLFADHVYYYAVEVGPSDD